MCFVIIFSYHRSIKKRVIELDANIYMRVHICQTFERLNKAAIKMQVASLNIRKRSLGYIFKVSMTSCKPFSFLGYNFFAIYFNPQNRLS